jgi:hypothetical protein
MRTRLPAFFLALAAAPLSADALDAKELQGLWAESTLNRYACTSTNRYQRFELAPDGKTLTLLIEHRSRTAKSKGPERLALDVVRNEDHALVVRFPGHEGPQDPLAGDWAISMLGPGAYRWHLVSAHETLQPAPIGVRCEP